MMSWVRNRSVNPWQLLAGILLGAFGAVAGPPAAEAAELRRALPAQPGANDGAVVAVLTDTNDLFLEAKPLKGEGLLAFCRRLCLGEEVAQTVREVNGNPRRLLAGVWYRVPLELLAPLQRRRVLKTFFPADQHHVEGWKHQVGSYDGLPDETLWRIAHRFTGRGENYRSLREANSLKDNTVYRGQKLLIPSRLLLGAFRQELAARQGGEPGREIPTQPITAQALSGTSSAYQLKYGKDGEGEYAVYRLKPGEALYSSVVVRFTGRIYGADVNSLAADIAARNGIDDVTDMPIGFPVKIPFDVLQPEFLPVGNPRRVEYEASLRASGRFTNPVRSLDLQGITVILDAGHGGKDVGTSKQGVWESVYVYDIMVRLKRYLETQTSAEVYATTRNGDRFEVIEKDVLPFVTGHSVLTTPKYSLKQDSRVGVNLRWYLANSHYRRAMARGQKPENVIFISIHADSLHPSIRGAMAYIPDANLRKGSFERTGTVYTSRKEVKEKPRVSYSFRQRTKSEGLSRQLAEKVIRGFRRRGLAVHPDQPVRQKIYRGKRPWVPAVLRYNAVPAELLLEVSNLANDQDRKLLTTRSFREQAALAVADGILDYYGFASGASEPTSKQTAR
ncbi:MAG: N-acetylmuramoyl-L-alanine amidase [Deltaproteobacteria bacterium]|nr:N-acetylmuramoyl-L-alanine amidase [Deltaproteobacteria bacterium]